MENILQALKSRTVLLAIAQAVVGILALIFTEADIPAMALLVKSVGDIWLRGKTTGPISDK